MRIHKTFKKSLKKSQGKWKTSRRARNIARKRVDICERGGGSFVECSKRVSDKLEALKSLIPPQPQLHHQQLHVHVQDGSNEEEETVKAEQLFQQTADYIIVLKTQVFVLQKLIEFYDNGNGSRKNEKQLNVQESS